MTVHSRTPTTVAHHATQHSHRARGIALVLAGSASNQTGAAVGALAFSAIGPLGVVLIRQAITALVLTPLVRPRFRGLRRDQWLPILGMVAVFSTMNISLYLAIDRVGLGLAVTLQFLGPLAVAVLSSRRALDIAFAIIAGVGVVVLTAPGPTTDLIGIALALAGGAGWASYILLNRSLGRRLPGLEGTTVASLITALVWLPVTLLWFFTHPPSTRALLLAAACGVLSSLVPYVLDLFALRMIPAHFFGMLASMSPVWAAVAGWAILRERLDTHEWIGIAIIVASNTVVSLRVRTRVG